MKEQWPRSPGHEQSADGEQHVQSPSESGQQLPSEMTPESDVSGLTSASVAEQLDRSPRVKIQQLSIPKDPLDPEYLTGRFTNVILQMRSYHDWFQEQFETQLPKSVERHSFDDPLQIDIDEQWAKEHPEEAERILMRTVYLLDDLCRALRTQQAGEYSSYQTRRRRRQLLPQRYQNKVRE